MESGSVVKSGEVWSGSPAKKLRAMLPAEIEATNRKVAESILLARDHAAEIAKTWQQIEQDEYDHEQEIERSEYYYKRLTAEQRRKLKKQREKEARRRKRGARG